MFANTFACSHLLAFAEKLPLMVSEMGHDVMRNLNIITLRHVVAPSCNEPKTDLEMPSDMPVRIYMIMEFYNGMTPLQMPWRNCNTVTLLYTSTLFSGLTSILL